LSDKIYWSGKSFLHIMLRRYCRPSRKNNLGTVLAPACSNAVQRM
jgi:hypothetical protein